MSFVGRCRHLLRKWMHASLVLSLSFVNQWMVWSEEQGAVKDGTQKILLMNSPKLLLHLESGFIADQTHLCPLNWFFYRLISILWLMQGHLLLSIDNSPLSVFQGCDTTSVLPQVGHTAWRTGPISSLCHCPTMGTHIHCCTSEVSTWSQQTQRFPKNKGTIII